MAAPAPFFAKHESSLSFESPPTPDQSAAAIEILAQAHSRLGPIDVSRELYRVCQNRSKSWHNDWLIAATKLNKDRTDQERAEMGTLNRKLRDGLVGNLAKGHFPQVISTDVRWAMDRFEELTRLKKASTQEEGGGAEREAVAAAIRDAFDTSSEFTADWFYTHTATGPGQIEVQFPGLWASCIAEMEEED